MTRGESRAVLEILDTCEDEVKVVELRSPSAVEETPKTPVYESCKGGRRATAPGTEEIDGLSWG